MECTMLDAFKSLPEDPEKLRSVSEQMVRHIQSQAYQIEKLKAELAGHRKARFGSKSESMDQLALDLSEDDESIRYEQEVSLTQMRSPFTSALAVSSSLRMIAMIATLAGFPTWRSAVYLVLRSGLKRMATRAGI